MMVRTDGKFKRMTRIEIKRQAEYTKMEHYSPVKALEKFREEPYQLAYTKKFQTCSIKKEGGIRE